MRYPFAGLLLLAISVAVQAQDAVPVTGSLEGELRIDLESLKGEKGDPGAASTVPGPPGQPGRDGRDGVDGVLGITFDAASSLCRTTIGGQPVEFTCLRPLPPATPIDCVVSAWTQGAVVPATCPASGMQSRIDTRTIVTQPANGGAACPTLTQTIPLTCTPPVVVPPAPPTNVSDNGTLLTWQARPGTPANQLWVVEQRPTGCNDSSQPFAVVANNVAGLSHPITGLAPGAYTWRIRAVGGVLGEYSPDWCKTIVASPPPASGSYDLRIPADQAQYNVVEFATLPRTTRTINTTPGQLGNVLNAGASNARVNVPAGTYGGFSVLGSDIDLVLDSRAIVTGHIQMRCQRCRILGGVLLSGDVLDEGQHVTFDNVRFDGGGLLMFPFNGRNPHHITVLRSTINARSGSGLLIGANLQHIIVAGSNISNFDTTTWGVRTSSIRYQIFADNRIFSVGGGRRPVREHADGNPATLHLWLRNQIESDGNGNLWFGPNASGSQTAGSRMSQIALLDNTFHARLSGNTGTAAQVDSDVGGGIEPIFLRGNRFFTPDTRFTDSAACTTTSTPAGCKFFDAGGNVFAPYQAPPAFVGGANH